MKNLLSEKAFKQQYVACWLATRCAMQYDDACSRGQFERFENQPVEDAIFLAEQAWITMKKICSSKIKN